MMGEKVALFLRHEQHRRVHRLARQGKSVAQIAQAERLSMAEVIRILSYGR
jgi:hypothetical protein